ncbi:MAG: hypothetical protein CMC51_03595 [Flavobacteriaceae bacterium]|nr:hypothetical protein [Flavobacteriaceae bacterium]|tara:strand:+ start:15600 stop:16136 length:537 start_codon:yes stop_codon:yes gene_type:complete
MKLTNKFILTLLTVFFHTYLFSQKTIELKNSDLEGVNSEGKFWWWNNVAKNGADATFSVEDFDTNPGSSRALKIQTHKLGDKGWFLSTQFNQKFKGQEGDKITVTFYAKNRSGNGKIKLVLQSDIKGSFQGKDFILSEDWTSYTHTFNLKSNSNNQGIKFWYMTEHTEFLLDDLSISK